MLGSTNASTSVISVVANSVNQATITFSDVTTATCVLSTGSMGPKGDTGATGSTGANGTNGAVAQLQDEGSNLTVRPTLNFTGAGVTCADNAGQTRTDCTVGSSAPSVTYWAPFGYPMQHNNYSAFGSSTVYAWQVQLLGSMTISRIAMSVSAALGTSCTGGACGIRFSLWSDSAGVPGSKVWESNAYTSGAGTGAIQISSASSYAAAPGTYWLLIGTDSSAITASTVPLNATVMNIVNLAGTAKHWGKCAESMSGDGSSLAFPATCTPAALGSYQAWNLFID